MDPNTDTEVNPAATVADAAMNGATPVVTTTDLNAADVAPEPTLQTPVLDTSVLDAAALGAAPAPAPAPVAAPAPTLAPEPVLVPTPDAAAPALTPTPEAPAEEGPVSLAPSADFQMGEVSTVSAVQNGADGNLAAANDNEVMIGQPLEPENPTDDPTVDQLANTEVGSAPESTTGDAPADFNDPNAEAEAEAALMAKSGKGKDDEDDEPIVAAAPVPGSIGSAKSYADIQRAEAEKAAKVAAKQGKTGGLSKNMILMIAIAVVAVIGIGVGAFVILGSGSSTPTKTPTPTANVPVEEEHDLSTLSCKRNLALEEYASYGAISGMQENIFYFKDDTLDGLVTNFSYTYASKALADIWRNKLSADYGVTPNSGMNEESAIAEDEEDDSDEDEKKTTAEMLFHYVNTKDLTVIHGMFIKSKDINAWLESDAYSDVTYGATENGAAAPIDEDEELDEEEEEATDDDGEVVRNLKYYNRLQNSIDYTCSISKGY